MAIKNALWKFTAHRKSHCTLYIMLAASEGLCRDMEVVATGSGIKVPVGEDTLGRLLMYLDRRLTEINSLRARLIGRFTENRLHLRNKILLSRCLRQVSKIIDLLAPYAKVEKSVFWWCRCR